MMAAKVHLRQAEEVTLKPERQALDFQAAVHWSLYAHRREREIAATINLANRIFRIPPEQWAKR